MTLNLWLLVGALGSLLVLVTLAWRHQRMHCAHLHELSDAVVALAAFIDERVAGELPEDVRSFITSYRDTVCEDCQTEDPASDRPSA